MSGRWPGSEQVARDPFPVSLSVMARLSVLDLI